MGIAWLLWHWGAKALRKDEAYGKIFCGYLVLTGLARFAIEFIRINPRSFFGLSNAQTASVFSVVLGAILFWMVSGEKQPG